MASNRPLREQNEVLTPRNVRFTVAINYLVHQFRGGPARPHGGLVKELLNRREAERCYDARDGN